MPVLAELFPSLWLVVWRVSFFFLSTLRIWLLGVLTACFGLRTAYVVYARCRNLCDLFVLQESIDEYCTCVEKTKDQQLTQQLSTAN